MTGNQTDPQFVINLAGVRPLDPADYFGYLKQSNGRLVFIQRQGEQTATLLGSI
jgi:hypothetical protein